MQNFALIFSSQNDEERKFRVLCFLSSLRVSLVFLSRSVSQHFLHTLIISHSCTKHLLTRVYSNNTDSL